MSPLNSILVDSAGMKFGRSYLMSIVGNTNTTQIPDIQIGFPITLTFDITHNIFASANVGNFGLKNLSLDHRGKIAFSEYAKHQPFPVKLQAGYISQQARGYLGDPNSLPVVFNGFANVAYTERTGVDLVTQINAFDNGDITNNFSPPATFGLTANPYTAPFGTSFPDMVRTVIKRFPKSSGIALGEVNLDSAFVNKVPANKWTVGDKKGRPFNGGVWESLENLAGDAGAYVYIENGVCNMLGPKDVLKVANSLGELSPSTGLLGIPRYTGSTIMCSMIFEPSLRIGAKINLKSKYNQAANGLCRIVAYTHRGTISGVESGDLSTDVTLMNLATPLAAGVGP